MKCLKNMKILQALLSPIKESSVQKPAGSMYYPNLNKTIFPTSTFFDV